MAEIPLKLYRIINKNGTQVDYVYAEYLSATPAGFALFIDEGITTRRMVYAIPFGCGAKELGNPLRSRKMTVAELTKAYKRGRLAEL